MKMLKFNEFILEKLGVAESSLIFVDFISSRIKQRFKHFMSKEDEKELDYVENIGFNSIEKYITDIELYKKFPVVGFDLKYNFVKYSDFDFDKDFPRLSKISNVSVGGGAQSFGNRNWKSYTRLSDPYLGADVGIILFLEIDIHVNSDEFDIDDEIDLDLLQEGINSTLYHELNHFYEMYKLTQVPNKPGENKKIKDKGTLNVGITHAQQKLIIS